MTATRSQRFMIICMLCSMMTIVRPLEATSLRSSAARSEASRPFMRRLVRPASAGWAPPPAHGPVRGAAARHRRGSLPGRRHAPTVRRIEQRVHARRQALFAGTEALAGREHVEQEIAEFRVAADHDVLAHGHGFEKPDGLEGPRDPATCDLLRRETGDLLAAEFDATIIRPDQPRDDVEERGLSGAVRTDQPEEFALADTDRTSRTALTPRSCDRRR